MKEYNDKTQSILDAVSKLDMGDVGSSDGIKLSLVQWKILLRNKHIAKFSPDKSFYTKEQIINIIKVLSNI